eukprot:TRINITY_DN677_c0_g1_i1.p1 TRINITY_DN677_c0_g1~~TRINITY_DN677_c0_g1_i1.p1  ORF type:complete len:213 (+),score=47.71 TRINITY_DN677_c0_g1_i1:269-907(+)
MGLFATGPIKAGEIVSWEYAEPYAGLDDNRPGNKIMTLAQMHEKWPKQEDFEKFMGWFYQIGEDEFVGPLSDEYVCITTYQNHSCDPNTWWYDDFTLVARRDVAEGEELTFDYATSESEPNPAMPMCLCGASVCRGEVLPDDYLLPEVQERYGNHFVSYLKERIAKHKAEKAAAEGTTPIDNTKETSEEFKKELFEKLPQLDAFIDFHELTS